MISKKNLLALPICSVLLIAGCQKENNTPNYVSSSSSSNKTPIFNQTIYDNSLYLQQNGLLSTNPGNAWTEDPMTNGIAKTFIIKNIDAKYNPNKLTSVEFYFNGSHAIDFTKMISSIDDGAANTIDVVICYSFTNKEVTGLPCSEEFKEKWDNIQFFNHINRTPESAFKDGLPMTLKQFSAKSGNLSKVFPSLQNGTVKVSVIPRDGTNSFLRLGARPNQNALSKISIPFDIKSEVILLSEEKNAKVTYPDSELCHNGDRRCGLSAAEINMTKAEANHIINENISIFNKVDKLSKVPAGCGSCHASGIDLAKIGYADADIERRAKDHLTSEKDIQSIKDYIHALRVKYDFNTLLHPDNLHPLQPGFTVLPGATPEARDLAFINQLKNMSFNGENLLLANGDIVTLNDAKKASKQLKDIDLKMLKIGVPLDRWGEDVTVHPVSHIDDEGGGIHGSFAKWVPFIPMEPMLSDSINHTDIWNQTMSTYMADPSDYNFWKLYDAVDAHLQSTIPDKLNDGKDYQLAQNYFKEKYKSIMIFQHMMLHNTTDFPNRLIDVTEEFRADGASRDLLLYRNPFWLVGDMVRLNPFSYPTASGGCAAHIGLVDRCMNFPNYVENTLSQNPTERWEDSRILQRSWFWLGWIYDPALVYSSTSWRTIIGDYFYALNQEQYQAHYAFILAKMSVEKAMATAWADSDGRAVRGHGMWASSRPFMVFKNSEYGSPVLSIDPERRSFELKWFCNLAQMWMLLVDDQINTNHTVFDKFGTYTAMRYARLWLNKLNPNDPNAKKWDDLLEHIRISMVGNGSSLTPAKELRTKKDLYGMYEEISSYNKLPGKNLNGSST